MKLTAHPLTESMPGDADPDGATAAAPIDQRVVFRLRASFALLLTKGDQLTTTFYELLFERGPALRAMFPAEMAHQQKKLTRTLAWVVEHLNHRGKTIPALREMGWRHANYGARREHYPFVRDTLLDAMARTAGPDWNDRLSDDWRVSIDLIARHMLAGSATPPANVANDMDDTLAAIADAAAEAPATSIAQD